MRYNNLTRLESSVFRNLLEKMAAEHEAGGQLLMYQSKSVKRKCFFLINKFEFEPADSIECDCHIAWLVRDHRDLLNRFFSFPSCSNGTAFFSLDPQGFNGDRCADSAFMTAPRTISIEIDAISVTDEPQKNSAPTCHDFLKFVVPLVTFLSLAMNGQFLL